MEQFQQRHGEMEGIVECPPLASQARPSEQFARVFVGLSARGLGARRLSLLGGPGITRLRHRPRVDPSIHVITLLIEEITALVIR